MLYIIFLIICISSFFVVYAKNPIQSVLFLVLVYLYSILIFLNLGAEYLALLILIVYVGALSIFFLFIVMMLNLRIVEVYNKFYNYITLGSFLGLFFFFFLIYSFYFFFGLTNTLNFYNYKNLFISNFSNIIILGQILYNYYIDYFFLTSIILFISFLGAISIAFNFEINKKYTFLQIKKLDINFWKI
jgi:NADH-quinone oxidoreductase subunit J